MEFKCQTDRLGNEACDLDRVGAGQKSATRGGERSCGDRVKFGARPRRNRVEIPAKVLARSEHTLDRTVMFNEIA